jgi:TRAP-type C4-dicarboxylate transport system permease small subunit
MTELPIDSSSSLWRRVTRAYGKLLEILLAACVGILVIPVTLQIVSRYTPFIPSYIWTEEMARFLFVWTIMIGAMVGVREAQHFEVDVWPNLSRRSEAAVRIVARWCSCGRDSSSRGLPGTGRRNWPTCRSG